MILARPTSAIFALPSLASRILADFRSCSSQEFESGEIRSYKELYEIVETKFHTAFQFCRGCICHSSQKTGTKSAATFQKHDCCAQTECCSLQCTKIIMHFTFTSAYMCLKIFYGQKNNILSWGWGVNCPPPPFKPEHDPL